MFTDRQPLYKKIEKVRHSKVLVYVTGDRPRQETKIHSDVLDVLAHHLDLMDNPPRISLYLYTCGGDTLAAWTVVNLIRQFTDYLEVIVPSKAHSAGTLMCLGANAIIMTKQATLGPIDPSVITPLNPPVPGAEPQDKVPVSVEDLNAFIEYCRKALGNETGMKDLLLVLADKIHPLVLGEAFRARDQIRMLAKKLMRHQKHDEDRLETILKFLCGESGSHDYTINRREARDELGLPIEKPDDELYKSIRDIYLDIVSELELGTPYEPAILLGAENEMDYVLPRALVESVAGGSHRFVSKGILTRTEEDVEDNRVFEGWRHV